MLISYSLIKIYIFGNDYFISLSLVLIFFIYFHIFKWNNTIHFCGSWNTEKQHHKWVINRNIWTFSDLLSHKKYWKKISDLKIKNFIKIHIKRGITYFWDPQHPARIHLYMLSSASISHQAFLLHLMQPCKGK